MNSAFLSVDLRASRSRGVSQARYLHREWNRQSPRVRKYHSVPVLRLVPSDRPLFFCNNCCSANFYVPMCLWCKWTSAAAVKNFEEKTPRGRTMSTPRSFAVGLERGANIRKPTTKGVGSSVVPGLLEPRGSLETDRSSEPPETPRSMSPDHNSPGIVNMDDWVEVSMDDAPLPIALAPLLADPYHRGRMRHRKQRPSASNVDGNRGPITHFSQPAPVTRSDDGHASGSQTFFSDFEPHRRSTDSRYSGAKSEGHVPRFTHSPTRTTSARVQSSSPPSSFSRRPLYHYIRSTTPTSQSAFDCGVVPEITPKRSTTPQHGVGHLSRQSIGAFPTYVSERSLPARVPSIASFSRKGFSLSGETEQKMDLARMSHDGRFVFHESEPPKIRDRIMRGLRRSFRSFFNSKVDR